MTLEETTKQLWDLHHRFIANSGIVVGSTEDMRFCALAMCGEVGEVANVVKKEWRGDGAEMLRLRDELSDVFVYWCLLVRCAGFDVAGVIARSHSKAVERLALLEVDR